MNLIGRRILISVAIAANICLFAQTDKALAQNVDTSSWQEYGAPDNAFEMRVPRGWSVNLDKPTGRIDVQNERGAILSILPFAVSNMTLEKLNPKVFFEMIIKSFAPNEAWSSPQPVGENAFRATYANATENASSAIVVSQNGSSVLGQICIVKLPVKGQSTDAEEFAAILGTLKFNATTSGVNNGGINSGSSSGTDAGGTDAGVPYGGTPNAGNPSVSNWTKFTDPSEQSFFVDVPVGWKVDGGLTRYGALDVRPWVKVVSPDNLITAFIGDGKISPCTMPTAQGTALGFGIGSRYNGTIVQPYVPARQFAERYAKTLLKTFLTDVQVTEEHNHPDVAAAVNGTVGATKSEAASIKLTGMYGSTPAVAYFLAVTKATVAYGTGMWWVTKIAGVVGPAERDAEGLSVILHMLQSFEVNPAWESNSLRNTAAVSQHYRQVSQQVSRSISERYWSQQAHNDKMNQSYWNRQAIQDRAANNFSNYVRGVENVRDTSTGQDFQVQYGPASHYIDSGSNYVVGSDQGAPAPDWRELIRLP